MIFSLLIGTLIGEIINSNMLLALIVPVVYHIFS